MSRFLIVIILVLTACQTSQEAVTKKEAAVLLHYAKGPCLGGRCPVYDFWVFTNGTYVYQSPKGPRVMRKIQGRLSKKELTLLKTILASNDTVNMDFKKIRDLPITTLKHHQNKYQYHPTKINGSLKDTNDHITQLVKQKTAY